MPKASDIKIGLLNGADCANSLEPQEVVSTRDGGPFAYRSPLGLESIQKIYLERTYN